MLEVVAAFAILALGLGLAMQAASGAMNQTRRAAEETHAALLAQTVLDSLGAVEPLEEGEYGGEFEHGYRWQAVVYPYQLPESELGELAATGIQAVQLYKVELEVQWMRGDRPARARFSTLRAMYARNN